MNKMIITAVGLLALGLMPGCYESTDAPSFEPGVYKGSMDPLVAKQRDGAAGEALIERFKLVQMDR